MAAGDKVCGIYKITSPTGRVYIGQSKDVHKRKWAYRGEDSRKQPLVYASVQKHGWDNHTHEVVEELPSDVAILDEREIYWIDLYKCNKNRYPNHKGMNLTDGGAGRLGSKWSDEFRALALGVRRCKGEKVDNTLKILAREEYKRFRQEQRENKPPKPPRVYKVSEQTLKNIREAAKKFMGNNNPNSKKVLDLQTGIYYDCVREYAEARGRTYSSVSHKIARRTETNLHIIS